MIPPTMGAAIGFITSEPIPLSQRMGTRLARTAQTVISWTSADLDRSTAFLELLIVTD